MEMRRVLQVLTYARQGSNQYSACSKRLVTRLHTQTWPDSFQCFTFADIRRPIRLFHFGGETTTADGVARARTISQLYPTCDRVRPYDRHMGRPAA